MNCLEVREIDHRITICVSTAHIESSDFNATKIDSSLIGEDQPWRGVLVTPYHVVPSILVGNDLGNVDVFDVTT